MISVVHNDLELLCFAFSTPEDELRRAEFWRNVQAKRVARNHRELIRGYVREACGRAHGGTRGGCDMGCGGGGVADPAVGGVDKVGRQGGDRQ
ncbi:hypothetical protein GOP47_0030785, partial [Adiantum capillus-veneris]